MKTLPILLFALLVLTGCASTQMSEDDRFIWGEDSKSSASATPSK
jgi:hypothetical protein